MDIRAKLFLMIGLIGLAVGGYILMLMTYLDPADQTLWIVDTWSLNPYEQSVVSSGINPGSDMSRIVSSGSVQAIQTGSLTIAIPYWILTTWLRASLEQMATNKSVILTITGSLHLEEYRTIITQGYLKSDRIGLVMIPTDWVESLTGQIQYFQFPESLSPYFHVLRQPIVDDTSMTMIPFALDPLVMLWRQEISFGTDQPSMSQLIDLWMVWPQLRKDALTVLRWVTTRDRELARQGRAVDPGWMDITYRIIQDLVAWWSQDLIKRLIDIPVLQLIGGWSPAQLVKVSKTLTKQQIVCQREPILCLMRYGYGGVMLWRLSDIDRQELLFSGAWQSLSSMQMRGRPSNTQPVRGRGRVVRRESDDRETATRMLNGLIGAMVSWTGDLRWSVLPAPNQWYQQAHTHSQWSRVIGREPQRVMMTWSRDDASDRARDGEWDKIWKGEKVIGN